MLDPNRARAYTSLGIGMLGTGRARAAYALLEESIERGFADDATWANLAYAADAMKLRAETARALKELERMNPTHPAIPDIQKML